MRHFAFDSFSGLTEDKTDTENPNFNQGCFATSEESFKNLISPFVSNWEKVQTIPGYYDKSLNNELIRDLEQINTNVALVNFDCDLPLSLKPALSSHQTFLSMERLFTSMIGEMFLKGKRVKVYKKYGMIS